MKKLMMVILSVFLLAGCASEKKVRLPHAVQIEFYSVATCAECKAFKSHAIGYFKNRYGSQVKIKMYDMDAAKTKAHYDRALKSLKRFDESYYGMSPFIYVKGQMAYLGYRTGDEKTIAKDIEAHLAKRPMSKKLAGHRWNVK